MRTGTYDSRRRGLQVLAAATFANYVAVVSPAQPLTALEASFLGLERVGLPMHVAAVVVLEPDPQLGPVSMRDLRRHVASRIRLLPRFQQRIVRGGLALRPRWTDARPLDLEAHLFRHVLPPGAGEDDVARLCGEIHGDPLPRNRPLWQVHLVDGGPRQTVIVKLHHSIADGVGGMYIAETLFDRVAPSRREGGAPPLQRAAVEAPAPVRLAQALTGAAFTLAGGPIALPSRYNLVVGGERVVALAALPMEDIAGLKRRLGGSVDDVLLALVAAALRRLGPASMPLRAMVPVSTWVPGRTGSTGNHVTAIFVDLPQDTSDLATLVGRIAASKSVLRSAHTATGMSMLVEAAGFLPAPLHGAVVRAATSLPFANVIVSDTPGPAGRLALLGRRIASCHPLIPLAGTVGLSIAAVSMGGVMGLGVVADPRALSTPGLLAGAIARELRAPARPVARRARLRAAPPAAHAA